MATPAPPTSTEAFDDAGELGIPNAQNLQLTAGTDNAILIDTVMPAAVSERVVQLLLF